MRETKPGRQDFSKSPKDAPYFGLGFALQDAIERSRRLVLKRAGAENGKADARRYASQSS